MKYFILIALQFLITFQLYSREYKFQNNNYFKKVYLYSREYRILKPSQINLSDYPDLEKHSPKKQHYSFIVVNSQGKLIRNSDLIKKVFFAEKYSQLNYKSLNELLAEYNRTNYQVIENKELLEGQNQNYFPTLTVLISFLEGKKLSNQLTEKDKSNIYKLLLNLVKNPSQCYRDLCHEIMDKSVTMNKDSIELIKNIQYKVISYRQAENIEKQRLAIASAETIISIIEDDLEDISVKFTHADIHSKEFLAKYNGKIPINNLKNINTMSLYNFTAKTFQKLFNNVEIHKKLLISLKINKCQYIESPADYEDAAELSTKHFPLYKGQYHLYSVPENIQNKYPNTLFYDKFDSKLLRWICIGKNQAQISKNGLSNNGDGWNYSGISSKVLFHPDNGTLILECQGKIGNGKGSFGFGEKKLGTNGEKGVLPFIGFLFNQDIDGSGAVDFRINNEKVAHQIRVILDLKEEHRFKIILDKSDKVSFYIDDKKVFTQTFKSSIFGSESVVISSNSDDYLWQEVIVRQDKI